ncbi:androgen-dependent TFPI-regulating protein-like [Ostrinia furnacalis]|uniref:androgen-dependent TFPI-regulating protein-like n=1 Tax=Ostrinia furnacalis TaxID=93504 RepID=UPI00103E960E|nr:androgen-dependent TFPI-regulating protein-like [Ostrinia furnacalis]
MDKYIYHRVIGTSVTLTWLALSTLYTHIEMDKHLPTHPELQVFKDLSARYNTVWNAVFLNIYGVVSLICDLAQIKGGDKEVPHGVKKFRFKWFHEVVFPQMVAMSIFWPVYFFDRELVFPAVVDILMPPFGNFVFHGLPILYVFWELIHLPEDQPKNRSDIKKIYSISINAWFVFLTLYTKYVDLGVWMYELLTFFEDSMVFPFMFTIVGLLSYIAFNAQWIIKDFVWKLRKFEKLTVKDIHFFKSVYKIYIQREYKDN